VKHAHDHYLPAAGKHWLLPLYDPFVALFSRERQWRGAIVDALDLVPDDLLVDVGCGTGSLAIMAQTRVPRARVIGIDPDPNALERARRKAARKDLRVEFKQGFGDEIARILGDQRATKLVSSFALHHMARDVQLATLAAMREALAPGGGIRIADFVGGHFNASLQRSLVDDLAAHGFENARTIRTFRVTFSKATLVGAERPRA
jgi:ubiquinone/menaquinone biosynthesis C-methylase UbiE